MNTFIPVINVYSSEIYQIEDKDIKNLLEGEIPLNSLPKQRCKKCFGRGHIGFDKVSETYILCPKCSIDNLNTKYMSDINYNALGKRA